MKPKYTKKQHKIKGLPMKQHKDYMQYDYINKADRRKKRSIRKKRKNRKDAEGFYVGNNIIWVYSKKTQSLCTTKCWSEYPF